MRAWRKIVEPQKPGNSPRSGLKVVCTKCVSKEWAVQRACSWTELNEMRSVLSLMTAGVIWRILNFAKSRMNKSFVEGCVHCSEDRGRSKHDKKAEVPQWILEGPVCLKIWWNRTTPVLEIVTRDKVELGKSRTLARNRRVRQRESEREREWSRKVNATFDEKQI